MSTGAHAYLVERAGHWLRGARKCAVVATEKPVWYLPVIPDAMGWTRDGYSIHIECKVSFEDFKNDRYKPGVGDGIKLGDERWYLALPGVLKASDMPEGVGLLEVQKKSLRKVVPAKRAPRPLADRAEAIIVLQIAWHAVRGHLGRPGKVCRITAHERPEDAEEQRVA